MTSDENSSEKVERFEYIRMNKALFYILSNLYGEDGKGVTHEEITEVLEENGENIPGLLIRLQRGVKLGLIKHSGVSALNYRKYFLTEEGVELHESRKLSMYLEKKRKEEKKIIDRIREKTKYVA